MARGRAHMRRLSITIRRTSAATSDTTGIFGGQPLQNGDVGDNEVIAEIQALRPLMESKELWKQDWSDIGIQRSPNGTPLYFKPDDFFWWFDPAVPGQPTDGSPAWQPGQKYPVRSLADLQDQYPGYPGNPSLPGILTDIGTLGP